MYGYPKTVRTRADVEYLVSYLGTPWATPENVARGLGFLRGLRDRTQYYVFDRVLAAGEDPDSPEPDCIVLTDEDGTRRQHRLTDDPNAMIYRLGYTVAEVDNLIATVEGAS